MGDSGSGRWKIAVPSLIVLAAVTACSGGSSAPTMSPTEAASLRAVDAPPLLVQCALSRGLMKPPTGLEVISGIAPWLQGSKVVITSKNFVTFHQWFDGYGSTVVAGQPLTQWAQSAASNDKLPSAVCGSTSATALQKQVFAKDPAVPNPWGT